MDAFTCPNCGKLHKIEEIELYEVYDGDGTETEVQCLGCEMKIIVTSIITGWTFETRINTEV